MFDETPRILCIGGSMLTRNPDLIRGWPGHLADLVLDAVNGSNTGLKAGAVVHEISYESPKTLAQILRDPALLYTMEHLGPDCEPWTAIVLEVVVADSLANPEGTPKAVYAASLREILGRIRTLDTEVRKVPAVVLCTPPPMPTPSSKSAPSARPSFNRMSRRWAKYVANEAIPEVIEAGRRAGIRINSCDWSDLPVGMLDSRGYPTVDAARFMAARVAETLESILR